MNNTSIDAEGKADWCKACVRMDPQHPQQEVKHIFGGCWDPSVLSLVCDFDSGQYNGGFKQTV